MKDFIKRLAIMACLIVGAILGTLVEIGIATVFDLRFNGLTYMQYVHQFYQVPWHLALGLFIVVVVLIISAESIYRNMTKE